MTKRVEEKRRYLRLNMPVEMEYSTSDSDKRRKAVTKDISALGLRFTADEKFQLDSAIEITLKLPETPNPIHIAGRIAWVKKGSLENNAATDVGIEFVNIEEDNKNTFLKYLCDLIYG